tara:strand:- start:29565 stop:30194 length:630 start_codon:yes stop_codon:yes gene_type:complete
MTEFRVLVLGCGALAREVSGLLQAHQGLEVDVEYLPASLHSRPERISGELRKRLARHVHNYDRILLGYADCGTGGEIDKVCEDFEIERLPGSHCYEFYLAPGEFEQLHAENPATFYLTDYLAKHFDRLVIRLLGIDRHPELLDLYFGNYERVLYLAQVVDPDLTAAASDAADRLGLPLEVQAVGYGQLERALETVGMTPISAPALTVGR